jgi:dCMP deaminase
VGAILVDRDDILSTGYNGSPHKTPHCTDVGCLLDPLGHCRRTIHAEANAILRSGVKNAVGRRLTLYTTHRPCVDCVKLAVALGIEDIIYWIHREDVEVERFLEVAKKIDNYGFRVRSINVNKATLTRPPKK